MTSTLGGLTLVGLLATPTLAAPQQERERQDQQPGQEDLQRGQEETRLEFDIASAAELAFRVERRSSNPLGTGGVGGDQPGQGRSDQGQPERGQPGQPGAGDAMAEMPDRLRLVLRPQRTSEQQGSSLVMVEVSKERVDALRGRDGEGEGDQSASSGQDQIGSFRVLVDSSGRIVRMEKAEVADGGRQAGGQTGGQQALDESELRTNLTIIFGTGLHQGTLKRGEIYTLGAEPPHSRRPVDASSPRPGADEGGKNGFALRFDAVHDGRPLPGAKAGKEAVFTVLDARSVHGDERGRAGQPGEESHGDPGRGPDRQPQRRQGDPMLEQQSIGRATYSVEDGLVTRFEARPMPDASRAGAAPGQGGQTGQGGQGGLGDQAGQGGQQKGGVSAHLRPERSWISIERISGS